MITLGLLLIAPVLSLGGAPLCDLTECSGTVSLLGGASIGANTSFSGSSISSTVQTGSATQSTATLVTNSLNVSAPPTIPSTPAAAFSDPRSGATYFTLPTINSNYSTPVTEANFPTTQSASTVLNPTANQPNAPFNNPVSSKGYFVAPTSTGSTNILNTSMTSVTNGVR